MVDVVSPEDRSRMMSGIRCADTRPEVSIRKMLFALGYRFRIHRRDLPGSPDIVMPSRRIAIFVHGCFWHQHRHCRYARLPATRPDFWRRKLDANVNRDKHAVEMLLLLKWRVLWIWECALREGTTMAGLPIRIAAWINSGTVFEEIADTGQLKFAIEKSD